MRKMVHKKKRESTVKQNEARAQLVVVLRLLSFVELASCLCCLFSRLRCSIKGRFHSLSHSFSMHWDLISFKYLPLSASSSFNFGHNVAILVHFPTIYVLDYAVGNQN